MRGLSLVELMVSIAIGLVITIAVVSSYIGSLGATRVAEAQVRMNEDAQAALAILGQTIRMAGNNPKQQDYATDSPRNPITTTFIIRGCDGTFGNIDLAATYDALTCAGSGGPDSIAVRYEADRYNTVPNTAGGLPTDCLGQDLPVLTGKAFKNPTPSVESDVTYTVADNRFYVTSTASLSPGLYCKGNGNANGQRLVENVEDLQFEYGTAPIAATSSLTVAGYIGATAVDALSLTFSDNWSKVLTVRICVLIRSEEAVAPDTASAGYTQCNGTANNSPPDLRLRRAYSTTVLLRNRQSL
ncbi:MAG: PilW family protein [Ramlibacter sp.]